MFVLQSKVKIKRVSLAQSFCQLMVLVLCLTHLVGCIWWYIGANFLPKHAFCKPCNTCTQAILVADCACQIS